MHSGLSGEPAAGKSPALKSAGHVFSILEGRLSANVTAPLAVALSGGGDSVALLRLAAQWAGRSGRPLVALAVDHGLNPDSAAWTRFAAERAAESGAAFRALHWEGDKPRTGLPAAARGVRHALLARAARDAGACVILMGHTADDVTETERMRGGDAGGIGRLREWSPSPAWPEGRGVMLLRPLLNVSRADLRVWLSARGDPWLDDPANEDPRYARVRARRATGPAPDPSPPLDTAVIAHWAAKVEAAPDGALTLPAALLAETEAAGHILSVAAVCAGGGDAPPRGHQVRRVAEVLRSGTSAVGLAGARLRRDGDRIAVCREPGERARNPRPDRDGVIDGRFTEGANGPQFLGLARFRAACFLIEREAEAGVRTSAWP